MPIGKDIAIVRLALANFDCIVLLGMGNISIIGIIKINKAVNPHVRYFVA